MRLPINKKPLITAREPELSVFSIFTAGNQNRLPFLYSRYISIAAYDNYDHFEMVIGYNNNYEDYYLWKSGEIILNTVDLPNFIVSTGMTSNIVKSLLRSGQYVVGIWNEERIPGKSSYRRHYKLGDFLLYGYNHRGLESYGWINDKLDEFIVPYNLFEKAVMLSNPSRNLFWGVCLCDQSKGFDKQNLMRELRDFIDGDRNNHESCAFGWRAIEYLAKDIITRQKENNICNRRELLFLLEYVRLMSCRVDYMLQEKIIFDDKILNESYEIEKVLEELYVCCNKMSFEKLNDSVMKIAYNLLNFSKTLLQLLEIDDETTI